jgi:hypothetical protein
MGSFSPTIASNPTNQQSGKGTTTNSATSGQPQLGMPSQNTQPYQMYQPQQNYPNTIQQVDNTGNTGNLANQPMQVGGKSGGSAKGAQ